jgi:hypothetical protein
MACVDTPMSIPTIEIVGYESWIKISDTSNILLS